MTKGVKCWCRHCKTELPPDHTGPCPKCGKQGKDCKVNAIVTIGLAVSYNAKKVHKYTKTHPWFISISVALTIVALTLGYLLGNIAGLLIGLIVAILNWWLTPHAIKTVVEITSWGDKARETQEAKVENNTQQQEGCSHEDICKKLKSIERKIDYSSLTQRNLAFCALGVAFIILGFSLWPGFLEWIGIGKESFYVNSISFMVLGFIPFIYAIVSQRIGNKKLKEAKQMGTKGRKNVKKSKQPKKK